MWNQFHIALCAVDRCCGLCSFPFALLPIAAELCGYTPGGRNECVRDAHSDPADANEPKGLVVADCSGPQMQKSSSKQQRSSSTPHQDRRAYRYANAQSEWLQEDITTVKGIRRRGASWRINISPPFPLSLSKTKKRYCVVYKHINILVFASLKLS